ncbi:MAG: ABC transporter substrate-binding protein [Chloroflexota bacterium]
MATARTTRRGMLRATASMAAGAGVPLLAGCAPNPPAAGGDTPPPSQQPVTLRYLARGSQANLDIQRQGIEEFQKAHPRITVEMEVASNYLQKLQTELASGTTSDVAFTAMGSFRVVAKQGGLVALDPFMARDVKPGDYYEYALESGRYNGKTYVFPYDGGTYALAFNKDLFDTAQIKYPDDTWTWDQYVEVATRLTLDQNGRRADESGFDPSRIAQYGSVSIRGNYWYWVWANGGEILSKDKSKSTLDTPVALDTIQWIADLHTKRVIMPTPAYPEADPAAVGGDRGYTAGRVALCPHGRWRVSEYRRVAEFPWDVAAMPSGKAGRIGYGWFSGMSIIRDTKAPAESWELCKYWGGEAGQGLLAERGQNVPAMPRLANSDLFLKSSPPANNKAYLEAIKDARIHPTAYIIESTEYNDILNPVLNAIWKGEQAAKSAIPPLIPQLNAVLAQG